MAHVYHLLFHAVKSWSCFPKCIPYADLFFLYPTVMIYFIFFQLDSIYVFFSDTQSMHLWAFQLIKTTNQSVALWENSLGGSRQNTHDKLPLWSGAPICLRLHRPCKCVRVCVSCSYSLPFMLFCSSNTEESNFKVNPMVPIWIWMKDISISENSRTLKGSIKNIQHTHWP